MLIAPGSSREYPTLVLVFRSLNIKMEMYLLTFPPISYFEITVYSQEFEKKKCTRSPMPPSAFFFVLFISVTYERYKISEYRSI